MNPGNERIEFRLEDHSFALDGSHQIESTGSAPRALGELLQRQVDLHAGHHIPTREILKRAFQGSFQYEITKSETADEPAADFES
jgi:hypothetical protein